MTGGRDHLGMGDEGTCLDPGESYAAFREHLVDDNCNAMTVEHYVESVRILSHFLRQFAGKQSISAASAQDLRAFAINLLERFAANTTSRHVIGVRRYFKFLEKTGVIEASPARNLTPGGPRLGPVRVLDRAELKRLLKACEGNQFIERRDMALLRVFMATGARPDEVLNLNLYGGRSGAGYLNLEDAIVVMSSRGGGHRSCALDPATVKCLQRYLVPRSRQRGSHLPDLWLTRWGALTRGGLNGIFRHRREIADLPRAQLHQIRSAFACHWIARGGSTGDLMRILGVTDRRTIDRYAESVRADSAVRNAWDLFERGGYAGDRLHVSGGAGLTAP